MSTIKSDGRAGNNSSEAEPLPSESKADLEAAAVARIAALKGLGHSGEPEKHSRNQLRWLKNRGLVYEKTAAKLLGITVLRLRRLVLPDRWITNPAYRTAPNVPVYDPRTLLVIKQLVIDHGEALLEHGRTSVIAARAELDEGVREGYAEFRERAQSWKDVRAARRAEWGNIDE